MRMNTNIPAQKTDYFTKGLRSYVLTFCNALVLCSFILVSCAPKDVVTVYPEKIEKARWTNEHPTGFSHSDLYASGLNTTQQDVFLRFSDIELGLSKRQLNQIAGYYKAYLNNKKTMEEFLGRSTAYLPYITAEFADREMPEDLAYLAYLESGFRVKVKSHAGAQGLWQFMPRTGESFGLEQDWYGDWRHDPYMSTQAAADYLEYLNKLFDDWLLAVSAYNAGEGKIGRALEETGATNLDELVMLNDNLTGRLKIKKETLEYVPRFLALKKIMMFSDELGLKPNYANVPDIHHEIHSVLVDTNTDLLAVVESIGMPWAEFQLYNPALKSYVSPSDRLIYVHVPLYKEEEFEIAVKQSHEHEGFHPYVIRQGDSYQRISSRSGVPVAILQEANSSKKLIAGDTMRIPMMVGKELSPKLTESYVAANTKAKEQTKSTPVTTSNSNNNFSASNRNKANNQQAQASNTSSTTSASTPSTTSGVKAETVTTSSASTTIVSTSSKPTTSQKQTPASSSSRSTAQNNTSSQAKKTEKIRTMASDGTYKVTSGDTLYSIAREFDISLEDVYALNKGLTAQNLKAGSKIRVKKESEIKEIALNTTQTYKVKSGDTLWSISQRNKTNVDTMMKINGLASASSIKAGQTLILP